MTNESMINTEPLIPGFESIPGKELPAEDASVKELPDGAIVSKAIPAHGITANQVQFGSTLIEIKPTKMKYQRMRTAAFYTVIENYPLSEILAIDKGYFDNDRDGDKCVYDWLVAVTDDPELVRREYDNIDTGTIEQMLKIFLRVNAINEKREALKKQTEEKGVR